MDRYEITERQKIVIEYRLDGEVYKSRYDAERAQEEIMARPTWAEFAASTFPNLTPLYTGEGLCEVLGWGDPQCPTCCGVRVSTTSILMDVCSAKCEVCGKSAINLAAPIVDGPCVRFLDENKFRGCADDATWYIDPTATPNGVTE